MGVSYQRSYLPVNTRRRQARRKILPGFPKIVPFESQEELNIYFGGEKIQCLLCGKEYKNLGIHLSHLHQIDTDAYRSKYGIPWVYGLVSKSCEEKYRKGVNKWHKETNWKPRGYVPTSRKKQRKKVEATRVAQRERFLKINNREKKIMDEEYELILLVMKEKKLTAKEVIQLFPRGPQQTAFYAYCREREDFRNRYQEILLNLPFETLGRAELLSTNPRYQKEVLALQQRGLTFKEIAKKISAGTTMTAHRAYKNATKGKV